VKGIELASLTLLSLAAFLLLVLVGATAIVRYTEAPPIYNASAAAPESSSLTRIQQATSLEGLRQVCAFWAQRDDQFRAYMTQSANRGMLMIHAFAIAVGILATIFGSGSLYIYATSRRLRRTQEHAL
jgi:hypothetical protein